MSGALSDEEQETFFSLLRRVCEFHVDQFLSMRVETEPMPFHVDIGLAPLAGDESLYFTVTPDTRLTNQRLGPSIHGHE